MAMVAPLGRCRPVDAYQKMNRVGEGTYGVVCKWGRTERERERHTVRT